MIKNIINRVCVIFSLSVFLSLIGIFSLIVYFNAPNRHHAQDKKFVVESGLTLRQVVNKLHNEEIIRNPKAFLYISQIVKGYNPTVRYGEYFFEKNLSYYKIMHKMVKGYISFRKVTIAEGLSVHSALVLFL
jgi:cell division protein YceG involved in septum cleavage